MKKRAPSLKTTRIFKVFLKSLVSHRGVFVFISG